MITLALLTTAILFGGMILYSFGFAAFLFSALPMDVARSTIRKAFPHFYAFVIVAALGGAALSATHDTVSAGVLVLIAVTTLPARQVLMPAINRATDSGATSRFKWLHGASVLITLAHIGLTGFVLARFA
jgi:Domain of unknown function (DUF4149)